MHENALNRSVRVLSTHPKSALRAKVSTTWTFRVKSASVSGVLAKGVRHHCRIRTWSRVHEHKSCCTSSARAQGVVHSLWNARTTSYKSHFYQPKRVKRVWISEAQIAVISRHGCASSQQEMSSFQFTGCELLSSWTKNATMVIADFTTRIVWGLTAGIYVSTAAICSCLLSAVSHP